MRNGTISLTKRQFAAMVKEIESSTAKTDAEGTTQESLEESVSSDGQSDSQAGGVGNEVSGK